MKISSSQFLPQLQQSGIDTSVLNAINDDSESKTKETPQKGQKKKSSALVTMVLLALVAVGVQFGHTFVTTPLAPGNTLFPGLGKSKCGYKFMLPSCENSNLFMGFDGVLSLYGPDNKLHWQIIGGTCENAEDCTKGLVVQEDGSLVIGGKNIDTVTAFDYSSTVSPWPFEQNPSLRVVRGMN